MLTALAFGSAAAAAVLHLRRRRQARSTAAAAPASLAPVAEAAAATAALPALASPPHHRPHPLIKSADYAGKVAALAAGGVDKLHLILDFDRTITTFYGPLGGKGMSCHGVLERNRLPELAAKAAAYNRYYHGVETSGQLTHDEKTPLMLQWYRKVNNLLIESGMTRGDSARCLDGANLQFRPGMVQLLEEAVKLGVPVTVFSAGIGDVIATALRKFCSPAVAGSPLVTIVSNFMVFEDEDGAPSVEEALATVRRLAESAGDAATATAAAAPRRSGEAARLVAWRTTHPSIPLLHMYNKHLDAHPAQGIVASRPNFLLGGDSLGDVTMADGGPEGGVTLRLGFLNADVQQLLPLYEAAFDALVLEDGPAHLLLRILRAAAGQGTLADACAADAGLARVEAPSTTYR